MNKTYRCTYNGCRKETTVSGERCQHGKAQVEMREIKSIPGSYGDTLANWGKVQSKQMGSE
jgi:hypothetical protein